MRIQTVLLAAAATLAAATSAEAVTYTYVGSWAVADGPLWSGNPGADSLSGVEAAAVIFGGDASRYAVSTNGVDPTMVNHLAFLDGYGDTQYLTTAQSETFVGVNGPKYKDGYGNYSAYVFDHACGTYYCAAGGGELARNYAFAVAGVPEPTTWALLIGGFGLTGVSLRRRTVVAA